MVISSSYKIFPLGDSALTIDFGNVIDPTINENIIALFHFFKEHPLPCMIETVPAYSSLTVYYDFIEARKKTAKHSTTFHHMKQELDEILKKDIIKTETQGRAVRIPVCYDAEFALDIEKIAIAKNISIDEVVNIHQSESYKVYMLGFLPGFTYMGKVNDRIAMPRKAVPNKTVRAGSVGIAGTQTGIYPVDSPGGWNIIGRTPLKIFDAHDEQPCLFAPGDQVKFEPITLDEFLQHESNYHQSG